MSCLASGADFAPGNVREVWRRHAGKDPMGDRTGLDHTYLDAGHG